MGLSDEMLKEMSYVKISQYRTKVMKSLDGEVKIPTVIAKDSEIRPNQGQMSNTFLNKYWNTIFEKKSF